MFLAKALEVLVASSKIFPDDPRESFYIRMMLPKGCFDWTELDKSAVRQVDSFCSDYDSILDISFVEH